MTAHVRERLSAFLDGELPGLEREAVMAHLRTCAACTGHLELLRAVDAGTRALAVSAPPGYFEALPGRIRSRLESAQGPRTLRLPVWTWAVAAALLLAVVTPLTLNKAPLPPAPEAPYPAKVGAASTAPPSAAEGFAFSAPEEAPGKVASGRLAESKDDMAKLRKRQPEANRADRPEPRAAVPSLSAKEELDARAELQEAYREQERPAEPAPWRRSPRPGGPSAQQQAPLQAQAAPPYAPPPAAAPAESVEALESREAPRDEALAPREKAAVAPATGRVSPSVSASEDQFFRRLMAPVPRTLAALRERREAWRSFSLEFATSPRADEARVRVIESGAEAWRLGADPADLSRAREDAAAYLARRDAAQAARVRAILESLPGTP